MCCEWRPLKAVPLSLRIRLYGRTFERKLEKGATRQRGTAPEGNGGTKSKTKRKPVGMNIPVDPPAVRHLNTSLTELFNFFKSIGSDRHMCGVCNGVPGAAQSCLTATKKELPSRLHPGRSPSSQPNAPTRGGKRLAIAARTSKVTRIKVSSSEPTELEVDQRSHSNESADQRSHSKNSVDQRSPIRTEATPRKVSTSEAVSAPTALLCMASSDAARSALRPSHHCRWLEQVHRRLVRVRVRVRVRGRVRGRGRGRGRVSCRGLEQVNTA